MLREDQLAQYKEEIEKGEKEVSEIAEAHGKATSEQDDLREKNRDLEAEITKNKEKMAGLEKQRIRLADKHNKLKTVILGKQKEIDQHEHESKINEMFSKQPSFWDLLEKRIAHLQSEMNEGLENFDDPIAPENIAKKFHQLAVESVSFSPLSLALKEGQGNYEQFMKSLCERQLKGETITGSEKRKRLQIIDRCLLNQEVERHWA